MTSSELWQAAGVVVTALGVLVALAIAVGSELSRRRERRAEQVAEAQAFQVRGTGASEDTNEAGGPRAFSWFVEHHGTQPVFDLYYEAWPADAKLTERAPVIAHEEIARPGQELNLTVPWSGRGLAAWRVRWRDRYGNEWMSQQSSRRRAQPFKRGEPPEPY